MQEAEIGNFEQARRDIESGRRLASNRDIDLESALTLARMGDFAATEQIVTDLRKVHPSDSLVKDLPIQISKSFSRVGPILQAWGTRHDDSLNLGEQM